MLEELDFQYEVAIKTLEECSFLSFTFMFSINDDFQLQDVWCILAFVGIAPRCAFSLSAGKGFNSSCSTDVPSFWTP